MSKSKLKEKLKLLEMIITLSENESDRSLQRFILMLTVNGGLIATTSFLYKSNFTLIIPIISLFGFILCIFWYRILIITKYYESRWHADMEALIESDEFICKYLKGRSRYELRIERPTNHHINDYLKYVSILISITWCILFIFSIFKIFSDI